MYPKFCSWTVGSWRCCCCTWGTCNHCQKYGRHAEIELSSPRICFVNFKYKIGCDYNPWYFLEFQICAPKLGWVEGNPSESRKRARKTSKRWTPNLPAHFATTKSLARCMQQFESLIFLIWCQQILYFAGENGQKQARSQDPVHCLP